MATDPTEQMRYHILETKTYNLAEQAGIFCDALGESMEACPVDFSGAEFIFDSDEPYSIYFEWFFGDVKAGLSFLADRDESSWFVNLLRDGDHRRIRNRIDGEYGKASLGFLRSIEGFLSDRS